MKLITIAEAAERLGVSRQTLENWGKGGVIKIKKMGKTRNANWVDQDAIDALADTMADVEHARAALEQEKAEVEVAYRTIHQKANELRREVFMAGKFGQMCLAREFYLSIPGMLESLDILKPREAEIMRGIIEGQDCEEIGERFGLSRERVRQIFFKGCRKARQLESIKDCLEENFRLKQEKEEMKSCIIMLRKDLADRDVQQVKQEKASNLDTDEMGKIFGTRLFDCDLSVRALNCLHCADIKTIGELCKWKRDDLLKLRNFGRRSLTELEDFLEDHGLHFGMDVDRIYMEAITKS